MDKTYLSASETLEKLCELNPVNHKETGRKCIKQGLGFAAAAAVGTGLAIATPMPFNVIIGVITFCSGIGAIINSIEGIVAMTAPEEYEGNFYYYDEGYTQYSSMASRMFGNKVRPVDNVREIGRKGYILANGIKVTKREEVIEEIGSIKGNPLRGKVIYLTGLLGENELKIQLPIWERASSESENTIKAGHIVYVMGQIFGDTICSCESGKAMTSD